MMDRIVPGGVEDAGPGAARGLQVMLDEIEKPFAEIVRLYDDTPSLQDRTCGTGIVGKDLVDQFRDDPKCRLFLATDAGGVGLNLQFASVVVNMDLPWNPADGQCAARCWRQASRRWLLPGRPPQAQAQGGER